MPPPSGFALRPRLDRLSGIDPRLGEPLLVCSSGTRSRSRRARECQAALGFWNRALRAHIDLMKAGVPLGSSASPLSPESRDLERSLYLNLAQGYLKTGEPGRALRACQVVTLEHRDDAKVVTRRGGSAQGGSIGGRLEIVMAAAWERPILAENMRSPGQPSA